MAAERIQTFEEFWAFYVGEHRDPLCRALHYAGTTMAIGTVAAAAVTLNPAWLLLTPIVGYGPAWVGHFFVEGNKPASFTYPLWSFRGDLKMLAYAARGKMAAEVTRLYGSPAPAKDAPLLVDVRADGASAHAV
ncbi:MAG: DUF962 domain-containing protein [Polyangiaceae bacterium]